MDAMRGRLYRSTFTGTDAILLAVGRIEPKLLSSAAQYLLGLP
jgi:hypothetical protein